MLSLQVNSDKKILLGAIQLPSFLNKTTTEIQEISNFAYQNALAFKEGGFDGVFIQDTTIGEVTLDTVCNLSSIVKHVRDSIQHFAIGTQMECDNAKAILAVAKACSCDMVRIKTYVGALLKNNGIFNGQGTEAYKYKIVNHVDTNIFCDIFNLTGVPIGNLSLAQACKMALNLGVAGLIVCGKTFDETISILKETKRNYPQAIVICGGNANEKNINDILSICDGAIVSSCLKAGDKINWDAKKIKSFIEHAR